MDLTIQPTNTVDYYISYITVLAICYIGIMLFINFLKNRNEELNKQNVTMDYYGAQGSQVVLDILTQEQRSLRWRYLLVSTAIKAATWVKAPYLFALYNRIHGFTRSEIGVLYALDNFTSLLLGPIIGGLCDTYGRKKFCVLYCFLIISHISLRITGSRVLAYFAQILTGICGVLIDTAFESWVNYQSNELFEESETGKKERNSFLRELFTKQVNIDCLTSIVLTGIATYLYMEYNIYYPFYCCILFAFIASFLIIFLWDENKIDNKPQDKVGFFKNIVESYDHLIKKKALICLGTIESFFKIALVLFLFIWTPLLEETVGARIHPGAIFACFMLARLMGSEIFSAFKILQVNSYIISVLVNMTGTLSFLISYCYVQFDIRLILFIYFDGLSGIFQPLMSTLKSQMLPEKHRTTIMNFFRIPINIISIITLIGTELLTTYQICLICFLFMLIATIVNIILIKIYVPPDMYVKREIKRKSEFKEIWAMSENIKHKIFK